MVKVGIVDTSFSRVDMGRFVVDEIKETTTKLKLIRRTVPGIKDLAVACKKLIEEEGCEACIALGMPGPMPKDKASTQIASQGLMLAQLLTNRHILEVFVHEDEANTGKELYALCENRTREHAQNLIRMLLRPEDMVKRAGTGQREGFSDVGALKI